MKLNIKIYFYFLLLCKQHKGQECILDQENKINHYFYYYWLFKSILIFLLHLLLARLINDLYNIKFIEKH